MTDGKPIGLLMTWLNGEPLSVREIKPLSKRKQPPSKEDCRLALRAGLATVLNIPGELPFDDEEVIIDRLMLGAPALFPLFAAYVRQREHGR